MVIFYRPETTMVKQSNFKTQKNKRLICLLPDRQHAEFLLLLLIRWTWLSRVFGKAHFNDEVYCLLHSRCCPSLLSHNNLCQKIQQNPHIQPCSPNSQICQCLEIELPLPECFIQAPSNTAPEKDPDHTLPEPRRHPVSYKYLISLFLAHEVKSCTQI